MVTSLRTHFLCALFLVCAAPASLVAEPTKLTAYERAQGWKLLFDGESLDDWRGYRDNDRPPNWEARDGWLEGREGTALVTTETFTDFELTLEFRLHPGGHGRLYFHLAEDGARPEVNSLTMELGGPSAVIGAGYNQNRPLQREVRPEPGRIYRVKVVSLGYVMEYWLDGEKLITYALTDTGSAPTENDPDNRVKSFGLQLGGYLGLSGDNIAFESIKIRRLQ